jgi:hypothetical protein
MRGRAVSRWVVMLGGSVFLTAAAVAQERSAPAGAVIVRPVQVNDVHVNQPASSRHDGKRPTTSLERPIDPGFLSRPPNIATDTSLSRPHSRVTVPRSSNRGHHGRNRSRVFKPRFNVGFGVVVGYPVIYPYAYPYDPFSPTPATPYNPAPPARNTYSNVDSLSTAGNVTAESSLPASIACEGSAPCGGVSFDITPASAQIYIDGVFAGIVDDFADTGTPLLLAPGDHYVELRLAGYRTASFDVTIAPGEVTPYQGTLERLRQRTP